MNGGSPPFIQAQQQKARSSDAAGFLLEWTLRRPGKSLAGNALHQVHAHDVAVLAAGFALCVEAVAGNLGELAHELVELAAGVFGEFASGKGKRIGDVPRAPGSDHGCRHLRFAEDVKRRECGNREAGFFLHPGKDSEKLLVALPAERVFNDKEVFDERAVLKLRDVGLRDSKPFFAQEAARYRAVADELHAGFPAERNERFFSGVDREASTDIDW